MLTPHPDLDQSIDHAGCDRLDLAVCANNAPRVGFGLQKTWHNVQLPYGDRAGLVFEADELLIVVGQTVAVLLPPPLLRGVSGEREQDVAAGPGDAVVIEQSFHLAWRQPGLSPLVPAYLRRAPVQRLGDGISAYTFAFSDLTQLGGESAAPDGGTTWHGHALSLLRRVGSVRESSRSRGCNFRC